MKKYISIIIITTLCWLAKAVNANQLSVEDFSKDISDDLTNLIEVQKDNAGRSKRKQFGKTQQQILELSVANIQNQLTNVAKASSTSTNKRVKVQANRILGDEAYATGDYGNAITFYLKWNIFFYLDNNSESSIQ